MPLIFQYGSNTDEARLNDRERLDGTAVDCGRAQTLAEYEIAFNVWSQRNGCAASDLVAAAETGCQVWGVLYEIPAARLLRKDKLEKQKTLEEIEGSRYCPQQIRVRRGEAEEVEATTFLVKPDERRGGLWTSAEYVSHIVAGLRAHDVPEEYLQHVIDVALKANRTAVQRAATESEGIEALRKP